MFVNKRYERQREMAYPVQPLYTATTWRRTLPRLHRCVSHTREWWRIRSATRLTMRAHAGILFHVMEADGSPAAFFGDIGASICP